MDFVRKESQLERFALNATHLDDFDMCTAKNGPPLNCSLVVAQKNGVHVCWQCGEGFVDHIPALKMVEQKMGYVWIGLHSKCTAGNRVISAKSVNETIEGVKYRRKLASAAKKSESVATAAQRAGKIIL